MAGGMVVGVPSNQGMELAHTQTEEAARRTFSAHQVYPLLFGGSHTEGEGVFLG